MKNADAKKITPPQAAHLKPDLRYCSHGVECFHCEKAREREEAIALFRRCLNTLMLNGLLPEYQPLADDVNAFIAKATGGAE